MIAFPGMLGRAAEQAGMKVPEDPDKWEEARESHPHFFVFCAVQLCRATKYPGEHWDNAKVVADLSDEDVLSVTLDELMAKGLSFVN
jgi:hypothetical protein